MTTAPVDDAGCSAPHILDFKHHVLDAPLADLRTAASLLGDPVASQTAAVSAAFTELYRLIITASRAPAPPASQDDLAAALAPLAAQIATVAEAMSAASPRDPFFNHLSAWGEAIPALGWVQVDAAPVSFVADMEGAGDFFLNKALMTFKKDPNAPAHQQWVKATRATFSALKAYIKTHHTVKFSAWNLGTTASPTTTRARATAAAADDDDDDPDSASSSSPAAASLAAFRALIDGPLAEYLASSAKIGGAVDAQAREFAAAWESEADFLKAAASAPKPASADDFQKMLEPISARMGKVPPFAAEAAPRDPVFNHVTAIAESVGVLGWVAVDSKPVPFIADTAGAGDFYLNKLLMACKKDPDAADHQNWVKAVRELYDALKAFVKEYHTTALQWNLAAHAPKPSGSKKKTRAVGSAQGPATSLAAFDSLLSTYLTAYVDASRKIGGLVEKQAVAYQDAWHKEYDFLTAAAGMPKPATADDVQKMVAPIAESMGSVAEVASTAAPRDPFFNHLTGVAESVGVLGWVAVDSKPVPFVGEMADSGDFYLNKVLMTLKGEPNFPDHQAWVKSIRALYAELKAFVKEHHTTALQWNTGLTARAADPIDDDDSNEADTADSLSAFEALLSGPVADFSAAANKLGGDVAKQAEIFCDAWKRERDFLRRTAAMPKPASSEDIQSMLAPIAEKMGQAAEMASALTPRDSSYNHLTAISESVAILGWVAVDSKPVPYISDMEGAGDFYLNKLLMSCKSDPNSADHQAWVKALRAMYKELKQFVKEHHTTALQWNTGAGLKKVAVSADEEQSSGMGPLPAFDKILKDQVAAFVAASRTLGGDVEQQALVFEQAWTKEREFLEVASKTKKPTADELQTMVAPVGEVMGKVAEFAGSLSPRDASFNHLTAVAESVGVLGWVAVDSKPVSFVSDAAGAGDFYLNKLLMAEKKAANASDHQQWVKCLREMYGELKKYVKEHHTAGLSWNFAS